MLFLSLAAEIKAGELKQNGMLQKKKYISIGIQIKKMEDLPKHEFKMLNSHSSHFKKLVGYCCRRFLRFQLLIGDTK